MTNRSDERDHLISLVLGSTLELNSAQVAEKGGMSIENTKRLWRALGFPDPGEDESFGTTDVEAVAIVAAALRLELFDEETVFRMTRALGQTMSRLADWQVSTLVSQLERDVESGKSQNRMDAAIRLVSTAGLGFERLVTYAWRRHLVAATARLEAQGAADQELLSTTMTVGFADLSRFTALSNRLDDVELGILVESFELKATDIITSGGGRVIKTLGDAVLFVSPEPEQATRTALEVVSGIAKMEDLPYVRVGLATGSLISRLGDVFGPPVNLAARLSHVARSNRVLVDQSTADSLSEDFETRVLPPRPLRGFGNFSPITVSEKRTFRAR